MPKRILIIDDDTDDQQLIQLGLQSIFPDLECTVANNGWEAVEKVESAPAFDTVILDLDMPIINGFDLLLTIKLIEGYKKVPVVIMSTAVNRYGMDQWRNMGASYYLVKPNSFPKLKDELLKMLGVVGLIEERNNHKER